MTVIWVIQANIGSTGTLLERARLDDLMRQIDPTAILEDPAKDALLEFMDDFVEEVNFIGFRRL